jgi:hypothetical protein
LPISLLVHPNYWIDKLLRRYQASEFSSFKMFSVFTPHPNT